ncbi:DUF2064 domain-containing protein [Actinoplanes sp. NPDC048988]|uniref:TIGR04282 family arsenosugar biosynthesis glycosyltransferase n=1 Tax=Actinoplanes sp. NPDC048988 TaxID=3363901 RepID=UPI00370FDDB3
MIQILVMAKAPVPGRVKTRLCPPCTPAEAAVLAGVALADTWKTVDQVPAVRRTTVLEGSYPVPSGWCRVAQRGEGLGQRLAYAFTDTALPGVPTLLIGMDTPQLTADLLCAAAEALVRTGSVLGPAHDGGWWALGLRDTDAARVLPAVPMSTPDTGASTLAALRTRGVQPYLLPPLRDVDTAADALEVAAACPDTACFPTAVRRILAPVAAGSERMGTGSRFASGPVASGPVLGGRVLGAQGAGGRAVDTWAVDARVAGGPVAAGPGVDARVAGGPGVDARVAGGPGVDARVAGGPVVGGAA